jgi:hypothetical protein
MPRLLSGSALRAGSTTTFITLATAQPQLQVTPTSSTGYTLLTKIVYPNELVTSYVSSLGNIDFNNGTLSGNIQDLNITVLGTGTGTVIIAGSVANTGTDTGVLIVKGGVGISDGLYTGKDIHVNGLTIGQGYQNNIGGINNIVIQGTALPQINEFPVGQQNINIGWGSLQGISTAYKTIAIGRNAASTGTLLENTIAIGDSALMKIGSTQTEYVGLVAAVTYINTMTLQVNNHHLKLGTEIIVTDVIGMTQLNGNHYFVNPISSSTIALYYDINLQNKVDGSAFDDYAGGGKVTKTVLWNGNFGIGSNAGKNLINGEQNFFLGYNPAPNFTTGSYNFFMGHDIAQNMITGNANISIGGDNMVDGLDNQINIGSVFYYNGSGYLALNADTVLGLGTQSTSTLTGALVVDGGVGINGNLNVSGQFVLPTNIPAVATGTGALVVAGGGSFGGDLYVKGTLFANTLYSQVAGVSTAADEILSKSPAGGIYQLAVTDVGVGYSSIYSPLNLIYDDFAKVLQLDDTTLFVTSPTNSISTDSGALVVTGGVGIGKDLHVGGSVYSRDGNPQENSLLYTPRVTITNTGLPPVSPRVGDFWIDTTILAELQFIKDGTSTFWIQTASL